MTHWPPLTAADLERVATPARTKLNALVKVLEPILTAKHGEKGMKLANAAAELSAAGYKITSSRLNHVFAAYEARGPVALIDHRKCKGCGLDTCTGKQQVSTLHLETIRHWQSLVAENTATVRKGTQTLKAAWKLLLTKMKDGEVIRGLNNGMPGTWQDYWRIVCAGVAVPKIYPWGLGKGNTPPGMSYSSFTARWQDSVTKAALTRGMGTMLNALPTVRLTREGLRFMEMVLVDDKRLDCLVMTRTRDGWRLVEVNALFWFDVATGSIVHVSLHEKKPTKDGKTQGITQRDVQHGFVQLLLRYGVPSYGMKVRQENATASMGGDFVALVKRAFPNGSVVIDNTGTWNSSISVFGWKERGGQPRDKARIESFFGRTFDVQFGQRVKGGSGPTYDIKPGQLPRMIQDANKALMVLPEWATAEQVSQIVPQFETMESLPGVICDTLDAIETDPDHDREGFEIVREWRESADDGWKDMMHPTIKRLWSLGGAAAVNDFLADIARLDKGRVLLREMRETVRQRRARLYDPTQFRAVDPRTLFELVLDVEFAEYAGQHILRLSTGRNAKGTLEFHGRLPLTAGTPVEAHFDLDCPESGAWVFERDGPFAGYMKLRQRVRELDVDGIMKQVGQKAAAKAEALTELRQVLDTPEAANNKLKQLTQSSATIRELQAQALGGALPASASSERLTQAMEGHAPAQVHALADWKRAAIEAAEASEADDDETDD